METQWPLVIFTLFVCLTCGTLGGMSILALKGEGKNLQMTALITSAVSLVVGGIGAFLHLEHWERIFNGFGHITSGITQELIGCVALAIIIVVWFVMLRGEKPVSKALAWVTIVVAVLMVAATAHSYYMPARPAWGLALVVFYLGNACLLGAVIIWLISILKKDEAAEATGIQLTFIAALVQLVADVVFVIACALSNFAQYGYYADPTSMTTAPTHIDSLMSVMVTGAGAPMFWGSIISVIVAAACAFVAKKKVGASKTLMVVTAIVALATSVMFRVLESQERERGDQLPHGEGDEDGQQAGAQRQHGPYEVQQGVSHRHDAGCEHDQQHRRAGEHEREERERPAQRQRERGRQQPRGARPSQPPAREQRQRAQQHDARDDAPGAEQRDEAVGLQGAPGKLGEGVAVPRQQDAELVGDEAAHKQEQGMDARAFHAFLRVRCGCSEG